MNSLLRPKLLLLLISLLVLTACGGAKLNGIWVGSGTRLDNNLPINGSITVVENDTGFTGSLSFTNGLTGTISIGGTVNGNTLTFVQGISGTATLSGKTMTITASVPATDANNNTFNAPFTFTGTKQ